MSEEQTEQTEEVVVDQPQETAEQPPQASPLFKALYEAAEEPEQEVEQEKTQEPEQEPATLNQALENLDEVEDATQEEELEESQEQEQEQVAETEEPEKSQPKKKKIKKVIDPDIPAPPAPDPAFSNQEEVDPDEEYMKTLLPEEREIYELARFADENMDEYKGAANECKEYFEKSKNYIDKRLKEDPHADLRNDEDYKTFIARNRPKFTQADAKKVEREMVIKEAEKRAYERTGAENQRLQHELSKMKLEPKVREAKAKVRQTVPSLMPKEYHEDLKTEEGLKKIAKENPFEYQIMDSVAAQLQSVSDTFIDITSGMTQYDASNETHKKLLEWVDEEQNNFINSGQTHKDGKVFMRRERYHQLSSDKRSEYYTWSDEDLLGLLAARAHERINNDLENHRKSLEQAGYVRQGQPVQVQQQQAQPVVNQVPPRATSAPRPGGVPAQKSKSKGNAMLNVLGL